MNVSMKKMINAIVIFFLIPLAAFTLDYTFVCHDPTHQFLQRNGYDNCFDTPRRISHFVTYRLTSTMVENNTESRQSFRRDSEVPESLLSQNYTHSGFDRGHLAPASDMHSNPENARDAGLMTNIVPQFPSFNRHGLWRESERLAQDLAVAHGEVIIAAGPLFMDYIEGFIIPVPSHYFKMFIFKDENEEIIYLAYIFPHTNESNRNIHDYIFPFEEVKTLAEIYLQ